MLVYLVTAESGDPVLGERVCSWHPCATDALGMAKEKALDGGRSTVSRIFVRLRSKRDVCSLLAGKLVYDTWDTVFTCHVAEGGVVVRRHRLQ